MPLYQYRATSRTISFLFIHVPKTGGTAIEAFFRSIGLNCYFDPDSYMQIRSVLRVPPTHFDYDFCDKLFRLDRLYSFAIVRHPVQRMVSEYKWAVQKSTLPDQIKKLGFSDFLDHAIEQFRLDDNFLAGHLKPQSRFVGDKISQVFRYEEGLDSIATQVFARVGLQLSKPPNIPTVNTTASMNIEISEQDADMIRSLYAEDFDRFGY